MHFAKFFDKGYKNWDQIHVEFNQKHLKLAHIICSWNVSQILFCHTFYKLKFYFLGLGETIDPELCLKDKETGKRYWFACIVCPCNLYKDENLVSHVKGQKHQKRAIEKLSSQSNLSRNAKRKRGSDYQESIELGSGFSRLSNSRSSRSELQNRIMSGADYPFLGLEYITEYVNPGNPVSSKFKVS